jgi:hypothetical protein
MHRTVVAIGAVVLFLILNSPLAYAINEGIEVADVFDLTKEYYTVWKFYSILGVRVKVELTGPMLLIHGEKSTFTYRILVGEAPSGWSLNITEVGLSSGCFLDQPFPDHRYDQKPTKVLKGGESLTGEFTVNPKTREYYPGSPSDCYVRLEVEYRAQFGANWVKDRMYLDYYASYDGRKMYVRIRAKELPLEIWPRISSVGIERGSISIRGEIIIRNNQNWDIILTGYSRCISKGLWPFNCDKREFPASTIVKSGGEYILKIDERDIYLSGGNNPPFYVTYIIGYLYPGGNAENWLTLRVVRPFSETEAQVTRQVTRSPTTATEVIKSPTTAATTVITTTTRPTVPLGGAPTSWPVTPTYMNILMLMAPIALVMIVGAVIAAYSARKSRVAQSRPKAEETAQGPSEPTAQSTTQTTTQVPESSPPTSQETTQSQTAPPAQDEQLKPPRPKLQTPPWLHERSKAIISKLASAKTRIELGDLNDAILEIHKAVNATISLILEAEGLSMKGPDGKELSMSEKYRLIAERGWVSWNHRRYFIRLQNLRNRIEHYPERIHAPQTTASEVQELFRFHENFVRTSLRTLEELGRED